MCFDNLRHFSILALENVCRSVWFIFGRKYIYDTNWDGHDDGMAGQGGRKIFSILGEKVEIFGNTCKNCRFIVVAFFG